MLPFISLGPFALPSKALVTLLGIYLSLWLLERAAQRLGLDKEQLFNWGVLGVLSAFGGARLVFVLTHWESFAAEPVSVIWPLTVGYTPWAGVLFGAAALFFGARWRQLPLWKTLDSLGLALCGGLLALSLGDWLGGPGVGIPAPGLPFERHPVQLYEIGVALLGLGVWWWGSAQRPQPGTLAGLTTAVVALGLILTLPFRDDLWRLPGGWSGLQLLLFAGLLLCAALLIWRAPVQQKNRVTLQHDPTD